MRIRREEPGDEASVRDVIIRAFGPDEAVVADLVDTLRVSPAGAAGRSWMAEIDGEPVGHVMLTRGWLDAPRRLIEVPVLSPLGVVPEHQRGGVGTALVRHAVAAAERCGDPLVFLEGSPDYYSRLGFEAGGPRGFRKPSLRIPDAAFQVAVLASYEAWMTGTLVYAEPFWALDCVGLREHA